MASFSRKICEIIDTFLKKGGSQNGYEKIILSSWDPRFPSFQQGFNRRWFAPSLQVVYLCFTAGGVRNALDDGIKEYGGHVKIKSGGHCYEDFVYNDETRAIIDVTPMKGVGFDEDRGYFLEAGGTNWSAFEALFLDYGKVLPAGSCYSVGLGGHICGGGYGLLSRLYGLTVDWLTGVEIVVKDDGKQPARTLYVSQDSSGDEYDLYWAQCGGGGGNFGIITKYYFKSLPPAPKSAIISTIAFSWEDLTLERLRGLLEWYARLSARTDNGELFGLFKLQHKASGEIKLLLQRALFEDSDPVAAALEGIQSMHGELGEICPYRPKHTCPGTKYTFYEAVQTLNGSGPNRRGKYKSAYMRKGFPPDQVEAIYENLQWIPGPDCLEGQEGPDCVAEDMRQSLVQVNTYGGAINTKSATATPIPQRDSIMKLQYQTYWQDPKKDAYHLRWIRKMYGDVYAQMGGTPDPARYPDNNVNGCYYNYPDTDLGDRAEGLDAALWLYFLDNYQTNDRNLVRVKGRWDPNNYFNSAQSIPVKPSGRKTKGDRAYVRNL
ncbi:MAG: FAD-binding protein [Hormoscilla sp.]